jgi:hypothetical protein
MDRASIEHLLKRLARADQKQSETFEAAYDRVLKSATGRHLYEQLYAEPVRKSEGSPTSQIALSLFGQGATTTEQQLATRVHEEFMAQGQKNGETLQQCFSRIWQDPSTAAIRQTIREERRTRGDVPY